MQQNIKNISDEKEKQKQKQNKYKVRSVEKGSLDELE
jgi:hypothetical protein